MVLGVLLSLIVRSVAELIYLRSIAGKGIIVPSYYDSALLPWMQIVLLVLGIVGGFFLGSFWWRKIYVERVWAQRWSKK